MGRNTTTDQDVRFKSLATAAQSLLAHSDTITTEDTQKFIDIMQYQIAGIL